MSLQEVVLAVIGSSVFTAFGQWVFFFRKHRAEADLSEISNLRKISQEWRETAQSWKELADKQLMELIESQKERSRLSEQLLKVESKVRCLEDKLRRYESKSS